jgi:hypothetical protein
MRTIDIVGLVFVIAYPIAGVIFAAFVTRDLLNDPSDDDFGTPMRHRWDIVVAAFVLGPLFWLLMGGMDAITWCWKKIVDR